MGILYHSAKIGNHKAQLNKKQHGFTLIETMIVLAVSGILFASMISLIGGRRQKTEFQQAVNAVSNQIEQTMSDVQSGYSSSANLKCMASPTEITIDPDHGDGQGTNEPCVFLGKLLKFQQDATTYDVHILAGKRTADDFASSNPTLVEHGTTTSVPFQNGMHVVKAVYGNTNSATGAIALVSSLASADNAVGTSGSQTIQVLPVDGTFLSQALSGDVPNTNIANSYANRNPLGGIKVCLSDGNPNLSGLLTIGAASAGAASSNAVRVDIKNGASCGL